jgi:preprotein translocase subunit SecG
MAEMIIWFVHTIAALLIIGLVLIQHGKGADVGAAFGSGSAGSLFGASGSANFLSKTTAVFAAVFFISSLGLTYFSGHERKAGVMQSRPVETKPAAPAAKPQPSPTPAAPDSKAKDIPK